MSLPTLETHNVPPADERIVFLADHPEYLEEVSDWVYDEWLRGLPDITPAVVAARFATHLNRESIPLTMIALRGTTMIATASMYIDDLPERADLSPWLAAVYVAPAERGCGLGSRIVAAVEATAWRLGIVRLHLFTPDREHFYARMGWETIDHVVTGGKAVVVMAKSFIDDRR